MHSPVIKCVRGHAGGGHHYRQAAAELLIMFQFHIHDDYFHVDNLDTGRLMMQMSIANYVQSYIPLARKYV